MLVTWTLLLMLLVVDLMKIVSWLLLECERQGFKLLVRKWSFLSGYENRVRKSLKH